MYPAATTKHLEDYVQIIIKHWRIAAGVSCAIFLINIYFTLMQASVYRAVTKIIIGESQSYSAINSNLGNYQNYFYKEQEFATLPFIIQSRPLAVKIATRLAWVDETKNPQQFSGLVNSVRHGLSIRRVGDSRLFEIVVDNADAVKAQKIVNTASDVFIEDSLEKKLNVFKNSVSWLTNQLVDLEYNLESSQKELIEYIEAEKVTNFGDQNVMPNSMVQDQAVVEAQALLQRLNSKKVEQELELQQLLTRYTDTHPRVLALKKELDLTRAKLANEEHSLTQKDKVRESEAIRGKQKEIKYSILKRKVDINKELYNSLIQKMKEIDIASAINENNVYVMEYAEQPGGAIGPAKGQRILLGFLLAIGGGLAGPILLDQLDRTLRNTQEVENYLKLPVLSTIPISPHLSQTSSNGMETMTYSTLILETSSTESEAFRILRTNIRFTFPAQHGRVLLVTSTGPAEGKSTVSTNLALTVARAGQKVCLIDADLRIPRLHKIFGIENTVGLTNFLVGDEKNIENIIHKTNYENLFVIPSGIHSPKPAELLESQELKDTMRLLLERFDQVIFDSPPAGNIIDASVLASQVDGVVFVLEAGKFNRGNIKAARDQLDRVKANIVGVVFNKLKITKKSSYLYYYYTKGAHERETPGDSVSEAKLSENTSPVQNT